MKKTLILNMIDTISEFFILFHSSLEDINMYSEKEDDENRG